jgi:hypothetical protein
VVRGENLDLRDTDSEDAGEQRSDPAPVGVVSSRHHLESHSHHDVCPYDEVHRDNDERCNGDEPRGNEERRDACDPSDGRSGPRALGAPSLETSPAEAAVLELFRGGAILATEEVALALGWSAKHAMAVILRLELGGRLVKRADGLHEERSRR